jgi:hypothetical protein
MGTHTETHVMHFTAAFHHFPSSACCDGIRHRVSRLLGVMPQTLQGEGRERSMNYVC